MTTLLISRILIFFMTRQCRLIWKHQFCSKTIIAASILKVNNHNDTNKLIGAGVGTHFCRCATELSMGRGIPLFSKWSPTSSWFQPGLSSRSHPHVVWYIGHAFSMLSYLWRHLFRVQSALNQIPNIMHGCKRNQRTLMSRVFACVVGNRILRYWVSAPTTTFS